MDDDEILTPEQAEQLTTGLGAILPATEIYKLGWKSRNAEIASLRAQNELTHVAYVEENNRLMAEREALRAELASLKGLLRETGRELSISTTPKELVCRIRNAIDDPASDQG